MEYYKLKILTIIGFSILFVNVRSQDPYDLVFDEDDGLLEFGGPCMVDFNCTQFDHYSKCLDNKCVCEDNTHPDRDSQKCLGKVGFDCLDSSNEPNPLHCVKNAMCVHLDEIKGICACISGYIASPRNDECKVSRNGRCTENQDCSSYALLECDHDTSRCLCSNEEEMVWETGLNNNGFGIKASCRVTYGGTCDRPSEVPVPLPKICSESLKLSCDATNNECGCLANHEQYKNGCLSNYNATCTNSVCHPKYECSVDNLCKCKPNYETEGNTCIAHAGTSCYHETDNEPLWNCVANAECSETTRICECIAPFEKGTDGKCYKGYHESCSPEECNKSSFLDCINGQCKCEELFEFHEEHNGCLGKLQTPCDSEGRDVTCIPHAKCTAGTPSVCSCDTENGFTENQGQCFPTRDSNCLPESEGEIDRCNRAEFLECTSDKCTCKEGFVNGTAAGIPCLGLAGTDCKDGDYVANCIEHAICLGEGTEAICTCTEGFSHNYLDNKCYPSHNRTCLAGTGELGRCNDYEFLICNNTVCECREGFDYDEESQGCKGKVSTKCTGYLDGQLNATCFDNAHCTGEQNSCQCLDGFSEDTRDNRCYGKRGTNCSETIKCNMEEFLTCNNQNLCDCPTNFKLNGNVCQAKVGTPCTFDGLGVTCVTNSACSSPTSNCACLTGYTPHVLVKYDDKCYPTRGSVCYTGTEPRCNSGELLVCNSTGDGICLCDEPDDSTWNGKCVGLARGSCDFTERADGLKLECVQNATCIGDEARMGGMDGTCHCNEGHFETESRGCTDEQPGGGDGVEGIKGSLGIILSTITLYLSASFIF